MGNAAVRWSLSSLALPFSSFRRDILDDDISDQKCLCPACGFDSGGAQRVEGGGGWTRSGGEEQNVSDSRPALPTLKTKRDVPFTETRQTQGLEVETRLET